MKNEQFKREFKKCEFVKFGDLFLHRKGLELWNAKTDESIFFDSFEDMLQHTHEDKTMQQRIEELEKIEMHLDGGRGAGSGGGSSLFDGQGQDHSGNSTPDLPARMNRMYNGNNMSQEHTVSNFRDTHVNDSKEHAIMYDDDGFVSTYIHGNDGSVGFSASEVNGKHMIHNHPTGGWANFSKADLESFSGTGMKSLTASSKGKDYTITKGKKFDAAGFNKAINSAKTTEKNYDKAVDRFLKSNQKKYGYKYSSKSY